MGENGVGKTMFLDCIAGLRKYKGSINGNNDVIYLNQNLYFSDGIEGKDFVKFVYQLLGIYEYKKYFFNFIESYVSSEKVEKVLKTKLGMLSGGERRILFLLTVLSVEREWYILDEPFAAIDKKEKKAL